MCLFYCLLSRVGRSDAYATEYDLEAEEYVPLPKGDVHKRKEIIQDVTLNDLDQVGIIILAVLMVGQCKTKRRTGYHVHDG